MTKPSYSLFDRNTQAIIFGLQVKAIQRMLDFDACCNRETPSVACIVNEGKSGMHTVFFGKEEIRIPIYPTIEKACEACNTADVFINFASFRSAYRTTKEALAKDSLKTIVVIAEGIPERRSRELRQIALKSKKVIIGPSTVGGIAPGAFKVGNTGGTLENIMESKLYRPGHVAFISKSGGMSNEAYNIISRNTDGLKEGIAIGGDAFPGSTLFEHVERYEADPDIKMIVVLGEVGGRDEYSIVEALEAGKIKKPLVAWVTGTCARVLPSSVQFGHAGAKADGKDETADVKNKALADAGAIVPESFDDFDSAIKATFDKLVADEVISPAAVVKPVHVPTDFEALKAKGDVRRKSGFVSTIADDRGEELTYAGMPISNVIDSGMGIGGVIGLLWFKRRLPEYANKFIETVLMLTADHGPCVSGAHNTIVCARAGKDLMSSVASGMLTIGPRFGGAVSGAASMFKEALDNGLTAEGFVKDMKTKGINIQGIGHRVKSLRNPDKRVELLKDFTKANFPNTRYLDFALQVEQVTTRKKDSLILNVDGCIGVLFLDLMEGAGFSATEIKDVVSAGGLNGLFLVGRTIGMVGHYFDQNRLKEGLYRHPWDDVLYDMPDEI